MRIKPLLSSLLLLTLTIPAGAQTQETLPLESLAVPKSLGRVESKSAGSDSRRWIIHIQDIHTHLTAQQNIAAILNHLNEIYGIQTVAVEGGWSASSFPKSWAIPASSRGKQMLAQSLLEESYITGSTYAAIFSKTPMTLVGIEDPALYEENRQLYLKYLETKEASLPKIGVLRHKIEAAQSNVYNPDLYEFDKKLKLFRDGKKAEDFIPYLLALAGNKRIAIEDLLHLKAFSDALKTEHGLDKKKLEGEAQRLMAAFKYAGLSFEELLKSGKIPEEKLEFYPQAKQYLGLLRLQDTIPHRELFLQIDEAIARVKEKIIQTTEERELDHRSQAFWAVEKIIRLQASPQDLKTYQFYKVPLSGDLVKEDLTEAVELGLAFYSAAQRRDEIFVEKIKTDPRLQGNIAVVTGGFHADGMSEQFEAEGISYQVIIPDLGEASEPADEALYQKRLREVSASQTLSEKGNRDLTEAFDAGFERAVRDFKQGDRISDAVSAVMSYQVGDRTSPADHLPILSGKTVLEDLSDADLEARLSQAQQSTVKVTAVISMEELNQHLQNSELGALNKAALLAYLGNSKSFLVISGSPADIDSDLIGKRNVRTLNKPLSDILEIEKGKISSADIPVAVVADNYQSSDTKVLAARPYAGIFGALRMVVEDSNFASREALEKLMGRAVLILQKIYQIKAVSVSA